MRRSPFLLFILVVLALDLLLFSKIVIFGLSPDATVIIVVYAALRFGCITGMFIGFVVGVGQVAMMTTASGALPLASTLVGYLVGKFGTKVAYESALVQVVIIFLSVLILDSINLVWLEPKHFVFDMLRFSLGTAAYTAVVGAALAGVVSHLTERLV